MENREKIEILTRLLKTVVDLEAYIKAELGEVLEHPAFLLPENWEPAEWTTIEGVSIVLVHDKRKGAYTVYELHRGALPVQTCRICGYDEAHRVYERQCDGVVFMTGGGDADI